MATLDGLVVALEGGLIKQVNPSDYRHGEVGFCYGILSALANANFLDSQRSWRKVLAERIGIFIVDGCGVPVEFLRDHGESNSLSQPPRAYIGEYKSVKVK